MFTPEEVQNLRQKSGDSAVFNQLLSDPEFKSKVDRVQQANPNMSDFEKMKFPSAMIDIHYKEKPRTTMDQTANILNTAMAPQKKGALATLTQDPLVFAGQTLKNVPRSMGQLVGGVYSAVTNPIQTGKTLFQLGVGGTANTLESIAGIAGVKNPEQIFDLGSEDVAKAVGDFYVQRYGSVEAAANTLREDPAGFLSDLGAVVTGVGGAIKGGATAVGALSGAATKSSTALTGLGRGVRAAQSIGGSMVKTGINMEPLVIAGKGVIMAGRGARNLTRAAAVGMIPDNMVTKSLKVNQSDIASFKNLPGSESMGSFLMRKGVLSGGAAEVGDQGITLAGSLPVGRTRVGIIDDLGKIFNKALETVDNELAGVRQTYDILDDVPADIPKLLDQIYTVAKKYDLKEQVQFIETLLKKERVSLSELNQLKRTAYDLFRTYKTSNVPADSFAARQINQYERVLRKFIEDQAQSKGLPDIGALNDDIMKSREILDAIEKADAASLSKGKLTFGLYDGMFGIGAYGLTGDFMTTAGIVMGRKVLESTIFKTTFAKYLNRLDPRNIEILDKAFKTMRHTKESKSILRKVVAQTADDIKNKRIGEEEASRAIPEQSLMQQARSAMPEQQVAGSYTDNVSDISKSVNIPEDDLPLSTFSPQGVKDAAKMDDLVKGGMTPQEAAKSLNVPKTPKLTAAEKASLTPEERATGLIGGSDSVKAGEVIGTSNAQKFVDNASKIIREKYTAAGIRPDVIDSNLNLYLDFLVKGDKEMGKRLLSTSNPAGRAIFEEITGVKLPKTVSGTNKMIEEFNLGADTMNRVINNSPSPLPSVGGAKDFKMQYPDSTNNPLYEKYSSAKETMMNAAKKDPSNPALDSLKKNMDNAFNEWESVYSKPKPSPVGGGLEPLMKEARKYKSAEEFVATITKTNPYSELLDANSKAMLKIAKEHGHSSLLDIPESITKLPEFRKLSEESSRLFSAERNLNRVTSADGQRKLLNLAGVKMSQQIRKGEITKSQLTDLWKQANQSK